MTNQHSNLADNIHSPGARLSDGFGKRRDSTLTFTVPLALAAMGLSACGGGGGGGTSSGSTQRVEYSDVLSLSRQGSGYSSSNVEGFDHTSGGSKYKVLDQKSSNAYDVKIDASGVGLLEFDFVDADDTITFKDGSKISGFSQLKVLNGTVDFSATDIGDVSYVSVASSALFSFDQASNIEAIVSNSPDGRVTFQVSSIAEAEQLKSLLSSGVMKAYGAGDVLQVEPASGSGLSTAAVASVQKDMNEAIAPISDNLIVELSTNLETSTTDAGTVVIIPAVGGGAVGGGAVGGGAVGGGAVGGGGGGGGAVGGGGGVASGGSQSSNVFLAGDADIFNIGLTAVSATTYNVDVFLENIFPDLVTGVPAVDASFELVGGNVSVDHASVEIASLANGEAQELLEYVEAGSNSAGGRVIAVYNAASKFVDVSKPLFSFDIEVSSGGGGDISLAFSDLNIGGNVILDASYSLDV